MMRDEIRALAALKLIFIHPSIFFFIAGGRCSVPARKKNAGAQNDLGEWSYS
jgi:hypothetical protein